MILEKQILSKFFVIIKTKSNLNKFYLHCHISNFENKIQCILGINLHRGKYFEKLFSTFEQSWDIWTSWRLFNIIVIIKSTSCIDPQFSIKIGTKCLIKSTWSFMNPKANFSNNVPLFIILIICDVQYILKHYSTFTISTSQISTII